MMTTKRRGHELSERWSAPCKAEVVLRVIRGEAIGEVARQIQVSVHEVEEWRRGFLESGQQGLKCRGLDFEERELRRFRAKIRDMTLLFELAGLLLKEGSQRTCAGCGHDAAAQSDHRQALSAADRVRRRSRSTP